VSLCRVANEGEGTVRLLRFACVVSALMGSSALAPLAIAQQQPTAEEARDTITVTARRREEDLLDAPVAVTAFDANTLDRLQLTATEDLDRATPHLQLTSYGNLTGYNPAALLSTRRIGHID